jgi:hypothetical protein
MKKQGLARDEGGFMTLDFIFATVLVAAMFTACFAICLTLAMAEVAQYITFSTARVYFGGHVDQNHQDQLARLKFQQLAGAQPFKQMFFADNSYFSLLPSAQWDFNQDFPAEAAVDNATFIGARARFRAKILEFSIPIWGAVTAPDDNGFFADVSSYLSREPNTEDCRAMNADRAQYIRSLPEGSGAYAQGMRFPGQTYVIMDNGC